MSLEESFDFRDIFHKIHFIDKPLR